MEKLQPFIKHHYWICFGLVVIFALTGWWLASGSIAEATETRRASVDDSFKKSEKSQAVGVPNEQWIAGAKKLNEKDQTAYDDASRQLWERQKKARVWHPRVEQEMKAIGYFQPIENMLTRVRWGENYKLQFEEILRIVKPFDRVKGEGLVIVNPSRITHEKFDKWRARTPLTEEVWRNQEDLWLTKEVLEAVAATNAGAKRISESAVPEIVQLRFRGGDRDAQPPAAGGAAGSTGFGGAAGGGGPSLFGGGGSGSAGMGEAMSRGGYGGTGGAAGGASGPWTAFAGKFGADLLGEEFGQQAGGAAGGFGGDSDWDSESGDAPPGGSSFGGSMGAGGMTGGATAAPADRYVDDEEGLGYKTRAFLLQVKIRESDIPTLLANLTNSDFPVEIVRVDFNAFGGGSLAMGSGMGAGGMGGGMTMGGGSSEYGGYGGEEDYDGAYGEGDYEGDDGGFADSGMGEEDYDGGYGSDEYGGYGGSGGYDMGGMGGTDGIGGYGGMGGMGGAGAASQTAQEALAAAMGNPYLRELRIGGLMTLYQSEEESDAEAATEAAADEEAAEDAAAGGRLPDSVMPTEGDTGDDTTATPDATSPDAGAAAPTIDDPAAGENSTGNASDASATGESGDVPPDAGDGSSGEPATDDGSADNGSGDTGKSQTDPPSGQ